MKQPPITVPEGLRQVLLHACCAPCSSAIVEWLVAHEIEPVIYYYNPNIYPQEEYETRKNESKRHAESLGLRWIDGDYDHRQWLEAMKGLEQEPERGHGANGVSPAGLSRQPRWQKPKVSPISPPLWHPPDGRAWSRSSAPALGRLSKQVPYSSGHKIGAREDCNNAAMNSCANTNSITNATADASSRCRSGKINGSYTSLRNTSRSLRR